MHILSIDFDYFIDADIHTRNNKFPDGIDNKPKEALENDWKEAYLTFPEIKQIGVIPVFNNVCESLKRLQKGKVLISSTHKDIANLFSFIPLEENLEVTNFDFHHDNYISSGNTLDCANWVRHLMCSRNSGNTTFTWCKRKDSEVESLIGIFPYNMTDDCYINRDYDFIFICFSPEWTPPHLFNQYKQLCLSVSHLEHLN